MTDLTQGMKKMKEEEGEIMRMRKYSRKWNDRILESKNSISWSWEWGFQIDPSLKVQIKIFSLKWEAVEKLSSKYRIRILCDIARMSLSGYYAYQKRKNEHRTQEDREKADLEIIQKIVEQWKRKHGYRTITMNLARLWFPMNQKKVLRLMTKYYLLAKVRRKNPYKQIQKATFEHRVVPNLVKREFNIGNAYQKIGTDITYLRLNNKWTYLSIMKDMITGETLSWKLSSHLWLEGVQRTLEQLKERSKNDEVFRNQLKWAYIHSDQWFHYTHPSFGKRIRDLGCIQSMSRRWNCIDNAPTESFFGHMKDELDLKSCKTFEELEKHIEKYIFYYNNHRPQWTKKKMTPVEYRNHLLETQSKKQIETTETSKKRN